MRYQNPEFLYALFLVAIPIIIHLFHLRKHKNINFSSIRFLKEIKKEKNRKSKLKDILVLISRIIALSCIILAFSNPYIPSKNNNIDDIFIYLDNSFSMDADNNGRLLDIAKEKARIIIKNYNNTSRFYLITNDFHIKNKQYYSQRNINHAIDMIETSSSNKEINEIINRKNIISSKLNSHLYIISDMQKETMKLEKIKNDTINKIFLIPCKIKKENNISIDSCWIEKPVIINNEEIKLHVKITNHGEDQIKDEVVFLNINKKQKSQEYIDLQPKEEKEIIFNINTKSYDFISGKLIINDIPITFDNKLYFSIKKTQKINILCINQEKENKYLNLLFGNDSTLFKYQNTNIDRINYNNILKKDLVILNNIKTLSSGLKSTLNKIKDNGKSIIVIPPREVNINNYNEILTALDLNTITKINYEAHRISNINLEHPIYQNVFNSKINNINAPSANHYIISNNLKPYTSLLSFENNKDFLSLYENNGLTYLFSNSLDEEITGFCKHAIFVPTLINIATHSIKIKNIYSLIQHNTHFTNNYHNTNNNILHLKNKNHDIIPSNKVVNNKRYYYTNQINENGLYELRNSDQLIDIIAFNYQSNESNISTYQINELERIIKNKKTASIKIIDEEITQLKQKIKKIDKKEFWRILIILALIFFFLEVTLIKLLKI